MVFCIHEFFRFFDALKKIKLTLERANKYLNSKINSKINFNKKKRLKITKTRRFLIYYLKNIIFDKLNTRKLRELL